MKTAAILLALCLCPTSMLAAEAPKVSPEHSMPAGIWRSDQGDGTYINPVLAGDYSDPDAIRVGDDFYLTASSFTNVPGLPILHSRDLVNWQIIGHALLRNIPDAHHSVPRRGGGVWAPAIRFHDGKYIIYYPDPDFGIYMVTASDPKGPWTSPVLVDATKGAIDPCPFWDEDGKAYLVFAFAGSRAGISNIVALKSLTADGSQTVGEARFIIEGDKLPKVRTSQGMMPWFTIEGPKIYKREGWYYIFAPAGSVKGGWQGVFRSRSIEGPYEGRSVLDQGGTTMNGPHQGAWIDTGGHEDWFLHFQDLDAYGRRVMLEPMRWEKSGWPIIGDRQKGEAFGQPVWRTRKPSLPAQPVSSPAVNDDFADGFHLGWQWNANPAADWVDTSIKGKLRLKSVSTSANLWEAGNILSQKLPGMSITATTQLTLSANLIGERAGLVLFGYDYGWIGLEKTADGNRIVQVTRKEANAGGAETVLTAPVRVNGPVWVRMHLEPILVSQAAPNFPNFWPSMLRSTLANVTFSYSLDGQVFVPLGPGFVAQPGRWVGAQLGVFAQAPTGTPSFVATRVGYADFETFRVE